jgi:hypothetical protein
MGPEVLNLKAAVAVIAQSKQSDQDVAAGPTGRRRFADVAATDTAQVQPAQKMVSVINSVL